MRNVILLALIFLPLSALAVDETPKTADTSAAIDRGLAFLAKDAMAWKEKHNCVSCHHAALIVWAMREAKGRGHKVDEPVLAELTEWMANSGDGKTGVARPEGRPKALNYKAVYFAIALSADRQPGESSQAAIKRMIETVKADQLDSGGWHAWPDTRPPIFGPSDDTATTFATLTLVSAAAGGDESAKATRDKGIAWLTTTPSDDDPQSVAMRLVLWQRLGRSADELQPLIKRIGERQNADGGWSQAKDMGSDAWATGQALYALATAGVKPDDAVITRGRAFLIKTQRDDGSWEMTSRPCPPSNAGAKNLMPITGGGSAWGVLGLVRSK